MLFWPDPAGAGSGPAGADKLVHAGLFALLAATTRLRFGGPRPGRSADLALLVGLAGYAALSELVQARLLSNRSGDVGDLVADLAGVAAGWWLAGRAVQGRTAGSGTPAQV